MDTGPTAGDRKAPNRHRGWAYRSIRPIPLLYRRPATWYAGEIDDGQSIIDSIVEDRYLKTNRLPQHRTARRTQPLDETRTANEIIARKSGTPAKHRNSISYSAATGQTTRRATRELHAPSKPSRQIIAFWTHDRAAIDAVFRQSRLMRPKWDEKHAADGRTYGQMTIDFALENTTEQIKPKHTPRYTQPHRRRNRTRGGYRNATGRYTQR